MGANPSGQWTLFIADVSGGGGFRLDSWGISFVQVPEPAPPSLLLLGAGLFLLSRPWMLRSGDQFPAKP